MSTRIRDPYAPATKPQLKYAAQLGIVACKGITKGEISVLIDAALECRAPTKDQMAFAEALGIVVPEGASFDMVSDLLSDVVREKSIEAMKLNPTLRANKVIMHGGMPYRITFIGGIKGRYVADLAPIKPGIKGYSRKRVMIMTIATAQEVDVEALSRLFA